MAVLVLTLKLTELTIALIVLVATQPSKSVPLTVIGELAAKVVEIAGVLKIPANELQVYVAAPLAIMLIRSPKHATTLVELTERFVNELTVMLIKLRLLQPAVFVPTTV